MTSRSRTGSSTALARSGSTGRTARSSWLLPSTSHRLKSRADPTRLPADLGVGEAQCGEPGRGVGLVALALTGLLGRRAVVGQAVRLDDQGQLGPEEVDAIPVHDRL